MPAAWRSGVGLRTRTLMPEGMAGVPTARRAPQFAIMLSTAGSSIVDDASA